MTFYKRNRKAQQLLAMGVLMLCAIILLKVYTSRECELANLRREAECSGGANCRDNLYQLLRLSPREGTNCSRIIRGEPAALQQASLERLEVARKHMLATENSYLNQTQDCGSYRVHRRFLPIPLSHEEEDFPIAYSMVIHSNIEMFERLLRSIYAPQNIYCVHVDAKSPEVLKEAVRAIASCFDNVFVASKLERVVYASWSRVQADLNCMEDLLNSHVPWRYLLNTCGTDFPIKTNADIVRALKMLNGRNSLESEKTKDHKKRRWQWHHEVKGSRIVWTNVAKKPTPIHSPMFSGNAYFVVSRDFVRAVFEEPLVGKLLEWEKDTYSPDEHLWATLNRMPEVPGSVPYNDKYELSDMNALARLVKWHFMEGDTHRGAPYPPCTGTHRHSVCIYGAGDLNWMLQQHHLFANKFDPLVDNTVIQCLEEYLRHKALYGEEL